MWAEHGYSALIQATRGRGESGGTYLPLVPERNDGLDTLEWLRRQSWYDGRLGMWGGSYFGYTQWVLADQLNAEQVALIIQEASTDFYSTFYPGGAFALESALYWACRSHGDNDHVVTVEQLQRGSEGLPVIEADDRAVGDVEFFNQWARHTERDGYWRSIDGEDRARRLQSPVLLMAGWYDPFLPSQLEDYRVIQEEAAPDIARDSRLVIAPWIHANAVRFKGQPLGENFRFATLAPSIPWFDFHLRGIGADVFPAVRIFVMGLNQWRSENEWPLARTEYTPLYLHSEGRANSGDGDGLLSWGPADTPTADHFVYDPLDPVPSAGGAMLGFRAGIMLQNEVERRSDVLVYSTPPLSQDLEVTGASELVLFVITDAPSTDFTGKLVDVHPDGSAYNVTSGIMRRTFSPGGSNDPIELRISLSPTSMVFRRNHQIRLEVSSSNYPRFDRNPNTGGFIPEEIRTVKANQGVFHGMSYPSRLVLPLIPDDRASSRRP